MSVCLLCMKTMLWVIRQKDKAGSLDQALRLVKSADICQSSGVVDCLCVAFDKMKPRKYKLGLTKPTNADRNGQKATSRVPGSICAVNW